MTKQRNGAESPAKGGLSAGLRSVLVPLLVAAVAGIIALVTITGSNNDNDKPALNETADSDAGNTATTVARVNFPGPRPRGVTSMAVGQADAPVLMIMYSEYQCPYCGRHATETQPTLIESYVDTGVLRIEWRDFPFLGEESFLAANAGRAAADQDAFWEYTDRLFAEQARPNSGHFTPEYLTQVAADLGLDTTRFAQIMNDPATAAAVDADRDEGVSYSVTGTPAFFINGQFISGAQPLEVFVEVIRNTAIANGVQFE